MNAHSERFSRIAQEQFVNLHEDLLLSDLSFFSHEPTGPLPTATPAIPLQPQFHAPLLWPLSRHPECPRVLDVYASLTKRLSST